VVEYHGLARSGRTTPLCWCGRSLTAVRGAGGKSMQLSDMRDAIHELNATDPWPFTGKDFLETLSAVRFPGTALAPPFSNDLELTSPFFLVDHISHVPETIVSSFATLTDLERAIVAGFTNNFTSHCFAFVSGAIRPFRLLYQDPTGAELVFNKAAQIAAETFSDAYPNCRLEWL
jgi:hypothetical protein